MCDRELETFIGHLQAVFPRGGAVYFDPPHIPDVATWTVLEVVVRASVWDTTPAYLSARVNLNHPFRDGQTALEVASRSKQWKLIQALVNAKADINVRFNGNQQSNVVTALHAACYHKEFSMVYFLLENGADPNVSDLNTNFRNGTPLAFASYWGDIKLVTHLLKCGADPNLQGGIYGTALQAACYGRELESVNLLLEHDADPNLAGGFHGSALHACACHDHVDCAQALLEHKADPNVRDRNGDTPLHRACYWGYTKVAELLLDFGADATIRSALFILDHLYLLILSLQMTKVTPLFSEQYNDGEKVQRLCGCFDNVE
ncbi:hypothetical protein NMY22_g10150 [Coprinellus aureogranulatus]|nr:hypothetical protein NMY22_g10150 [Coprinellus aureogranulatus]